MKEWELNSFIVVNKRPDTYVYIIVKDIGKGFYYIRVSGQDGLPINQTELVHESQLRKPTKKQLNNYFKEDTQ